jgi:hypothetical protein
VAVKFPHEVRVPHDKDPEFGHQTLEWLSARKKRPDRDFEIDMHGGQLGYTSFFFKDQKFAVYVKLVWG